MSRLLETINNFQNLNDLEKGEAAGHEFRGNQYTSGEASAAASGRMHMGTLKEGQPLYDKQGQKVDEVARVSAHSLGGTRIETRAGYNLHANKEGVNAHGYTNVKPSAVSTQLKINDAASGRGAYAGKSAVDRQLAINDLSAGRKK